MVAGVAAPGWFARSKDGFQDPALPPDLLGMLTLILIPVSIVLVAFAMRGFAQKWNVEVETHNDGYGDDDADRARRGAQPARQPAGTRRGTYNRSACGGVETGKRDGLKHRWPNGLVGSSPTRRIARQRP